MPVKEVNFSTTFSVEPRLRKRVAFITGITGQDGSFLAEFLLNRGYEVHGLMRRGALDTTKNINDIKDKLILHYGDLQNSNPLGGIIYEIQPDEIYNLAAQSDVRISFDIPEYTFDITAVGVIRLLEAVKMFSPMSKIYQASSSEMYGDYPPPQNERTPMIPQSPYGIAKYAAYRLIQTYREGQGLFACNGILFNHESERRGENFVTQKIVKGLLDCKMGLKKDFYLGNINAKRDWGYAKDYVEVMWLMLQQDKADDYVIGTGVGHSITDFLKEVATCITINWEDYVRIDRDLYRPNEVNYLLADPRKAKEVLGWEAKTSFKELVQIMVNSEINRRGGA
jgi:GDPmannose 4,6-dehydratase